MVITSLQLNAACSFQERRTKYLPVMATWGLQEQSEHVKTQNCKISFFKVKLIG